MQNKKAYFWNFGGRVIPQVLFLVTNIVLARFLSPSDFGAIGVLTIFVSLASTLTDTGFSGSLVKEKNVSKLDYSTVFVFNLTVSTSIYLILFACSNIIEDFYTYSNLRYIVRTLCLVFVIRAVGLVPRAQLIREIKFKVQAKISIVSVTVACIVAILGGVLGWKYYALVAYQLIYALLETILLIVVTKYRISFKFSKESFKRLFSFGFFTTICTSIDTIYENIMAMLFGKFLNMSAAGYLSQAQKLEIASTNTLVITLNTVSFPILTRLRDNINSFTAEVHSIQRTFITLIFPLIFILIIFSREIIILLYGIEWVQASIYLQLLLIVGLFYILECLDRNNIKALGYVKELSRITVLKRILGLLIIFSFLLISPFAMLYGYIISTCIGFLFNKHLYCRLIDQKFAHDLFRELKLVVPPIIFFSALYLIRFFLNKLIIEILMTTLLTSLYYTYYIQNKAIKYKI